MVGVRSACRLKQLEEDAAAAATAENPPSSPSAATVAASDGKNASPKIKGLDQTQRNIAAAAPAGVSASVPVVGWRPSGAVTRLDPLRALSLSSCPIDGTAFGWTAAAAAIGAFLLDPAIAEPDGVTAAAASGGGGDSPVLSLTTAALSPPLLGCSSAYGGEALTSSSASATSPAQPSPLQFGDLLLLDLRGCFHPPHGGVSASTLSPPPKAALEGEDTSSSGQPKAEDEGGGLFLARQRGAVFVGLRLASLAVACLENRNEDEVADVTPENGNGGGGGSYNKMAATQKLPDGTVASSPSAPSEVGSENVASAAGEAAATTTDSANTSESKTNSAKESIAPVKPLMELPKPVSYSATVRPRCFIHFLTFFCIKRVSSVMKLSSSSNI